jgi:hypothetical protein
VGNVVRTVPKSGVSFSYIKDSVKTEERGTIGFLCDSVIVNLNEKI